MTLFTTMPPGSRRSRRVNEGGSEMRVWNLLRSGLVMAACLLVWHAGPAEAAKSSIVVGMVVEPEGLDPTIAAPTTIREVTWLNIYEGLVRLDENGKIHPLLASSWTVSDDGLTYSFKLQPNVKFHDGSPFDSSTVKFSLDRARAPDSTNAQKQFFEPIDRVETPDALTAVMKLKHPTGLFLYWLGWGDSVIVSPKSVAANKTHPVGTGPFTFKQWVQGDRIVLVRNPDYWQKGKPKLDSVTFRFIGDPQAQAAALRAGDIDAFPEFSAAELFGEFQKDKRFATLIGATPNKLIAGMNNARKPFNDLRVRQALMLAIDRKAVMEGAYSGLGTAIGSHYAPSDEGYIDLTGVLPYDPERAKKLLAEAGYPSGFTFTIKVPQMSYTTRAAQIMQSMFAEIGVTMNIVPSEFPAKWIEEVFTRTDYDMTIVDHAEPMDIDIYSRPKYYFNYHNEAFNALASEALATADATKRDKLYGDAQRILAEQVPALYLFDLPFLNIQNAKLRGLWKNQPIPECDVTEAYWVE
jgi:peptide/nickel transport system substrate-binding protein